MQAQTVRLGLVGSGIWARSAHLPSLESEQGAAWAALATRRPESAADLAREHGIERVVADWRELIDADDLDAIVIAAPAPLHHPIAMAALSAGKHVLCEAPLGMNLAEAQAMTAAARAADRIAAYVRPRPFLYGGSKICELLRDGTLGEVRSANLTWLGNPWLAAPPDANWRMRADAGPPVLVGVAVAVLQAVLGPVERVCASLRRTLPNPSELEAAPDEFKALMISRGDASISVQAGFSTTEPAGQGLQLFGTKGDLAWEWGSPPSIRLRVQGAEQWREVAYDLEPNLALAWSHTRRFAAAVAAGSGFEAFAEPNFLTGSRELAAVDAVLTSARESRWVYIK